MTAELFRERGLALTHKHQPRSPLSEVNGQPGHLMGEVLRRKVGEVSCAAVAVAKDIKSPQRMLIQQQLKRSRLQHQKQ